MANEAKHDPRNYVALLLGLQRSQATGVLSVQNGRSWRRLSLHAGRVLRADSSLAAESLARSLQEAGLVQRNTLRRLSADDLEPDELALALVREEHLPEDELARHRGRLSDRIVGGPLTWQSGCWSFDDHASRITVRVDPRLFPECSIPRALWAGTRTSITMQAVIDDVSDPAAGTILPTDRLVDALTAMAVEAPLDALADKLGDGVDVAELYRRLPDRSGHLAVLLWLLEAGCLVARSGRPPAPEQAALAAGRLPEAALGSADLDGLAELSGPVEIDQQLEEALDSDLEIELDPAPPEPAPAARSSRPLSMPARKLAEMIRADHDHRIHKDYYAFLDLPPGARPSDIERTAQGLRGPWDEAAGNDAVDADVEALASDLVAGVQLVLATLCDARKRRDYDRRLEKGDPPLVNGLSRVKPRGVRFSAPGALPPGAAPLRPAHAEARKLTESGDFAGAIARLSVLRQENPSDVDVLADLGWASWKAERDPDYLRLAVTFDASNPRALEYLGRVYEELGQPDKVVKIARSLLKVERTNAWAKRVSQPRAEGRR